MAEIEVDTVNHSTSSGLVTAHCFEPGLRAFIGKSLNEWYGKWKELGHEYSGTVCIQGWNKSRIIGVDPEKGEEVLGALTSSLSSVMTGGERMNTGDAYENTYVEVWLSSHSTFS